MSHDSIGVSLERRRLEHRAARLQTALRRLARIADDTVAAGREIPFALRSAERTFTEELAVTQTALSALDAGLRPQAEGA